MEYKGLTEREAAKALITFGENTIRSSEKSSVLKIFAGQFRDAMIMILLAATAVSALMGEVTEAFTIIAIVFLNAVLGFAQEFRTEKTLERLAAMSSPHAMVIREGQQKNIPSSQVVPKDILLIKAGDKVPADSIVLQANNLMTDESMLSGESENVEKHPPAEGKAPSKENSVYMGTLVTRGKAVCQVIATGEDTEMGRIAGMLSEIHQQSTPLQRRLGQLSKYIGFGCLLICAVVALAGILRGENILDMLLVGISLSVAAVPEGLPAIVTIALALSVSRMVKRNALVRRLHAVETLGCANVICSDKTGTLTENKMTVKAISTPDYQVSVSGNGYEKKGEFTIGGKKSNMMNSQALSMLMNIAVLCNNASIQEKKQGFSTFKGKSNEYYEVTGEPTEAALLVMAAKCGVFKSHLNYYPEKEVPFDSTRKMMSVTVKDQSGAFFLMTKGAPDILLSQCEYCLTREGVRPMTPSFRKIIREQNNQMAEDALRVLGFAYRPAKSPDDLSEKGMIFTGLAGLLDPPRKEAYEAVKKCRQAYIRPIMITGDYEVTAKAIAKELKIFTTGDEVMTGRELDTLTEEQLKQRLPHISVFARVTPAHKLRIVRTLKSQGNIVAMTGDGVNDAPAIKEADIGVAMGQTGTDVTKEASDVILLDDNFATLVSAVEEGRVIYQNIRKFIRYLLSCNIGEVVTMFFAMLMGMPVPLLPIQILLINLATDGLPAIALGLEPGEKDVMRRRPRRGDESVFSGGLATTIIMRGILIGLTTLAVFVHLLGDGVGLETARTGALMTLITTQLIHVFECKSETKSIFSINPFNNMKLVWAVLFSALTMFAAVYLPVFCTIFRTNPLTIHQLTVIFGYSAVVPIVSGILLSVKKHLPSAPSNNKKSISKKDILY